jgi:hypothetical protein
MVETAAAMATAMARMALARTAVARLAAMDMVVVVATPPAMLATAPVALPALERLGMASQRQTPADLPQPPVAEVETVHQDYWATSSAMVEPSTTFSPTA